jgi:hypothetical protein
MIDTIARAISVQHSYLSTPALTSYVRQKGVGADVFLCPHVWFISPVS